MGEITLTDLTRRYGREKIPAVNKISLHVNKGELFGLIGPDGAGKTSIFRMLTTLLLPDGGSASVSGWDIVKDYKKIRSSVGYMPGRFSLYPDLTVEENLRFFATVFGTTVEENYHLVKDIYIQLEPFKQRRAGKLSGGMKQKLALCCALIHKPAVLFLDEPTTGVDPVSRREFWNMLKRLREQEITILVSTPYMDEANQCDRIALMQEGNILSVDTPLQMIKNYPEKLYAISSDHIHDLLKKLTACENIRHSYAYGDHAHATLKEQLGSPGVVKDYLIRSGLSDAEINEVEPTIEDCFIRLLKH